MTENLLDKITGLATMALPPLEDTPDAVRRWRFMMWLWQMGVSCFLALHIAWACNWLPGIQGFAMAADMGQQKSATERLEARQLKKAMIDLQIARCTAIATAKPTRWLTEQINNAQAEFHALTGSDWILPTCAELGE